MWFNVFFLVNESENVMITLCYRASFINCACQRTESSLAHLTVVCISSSKKKTKEKAATVRSWLMRNLSGQRLYSLH